MVVSNSNNKTEVINMIFIDKKRRIYQEEEFLELDSIDIEDNGIRPYEVFMAG